MDAARNRRSARLLTALPTTALAVLGLAVVTTSGSSAPSAAPDRPAKVKTVAAPAGSPTGLVGTKLQEPGGLRVRGWAVDPGHQTTALTVYGTVDGKLSGTTVADKERSSVTKTYPRAGTKHGFTLLIPTPEGKHRVCAKAKNIGAGSNVELGCWYQNFDYGPYGKLTYVGTYAGALRVTGYAIDDDNPATALRTKIRIDGTTRTVTADNVRADTAAVREGAGTKHGYDVTIPTSQGKHTVCVSAYNIGFGSANRIACKDVVLDNSPSAKIDSISQSDGALRLRGWALDYDDPTAASTVNVKIDSSPTRKIIAKLERTDVGKRYVRGGSMHGFDTRYTLAEGKHRVCVTVTNVGYGKTRDLGCHNVTLDFTPDAALTSLTAASTGFAVAGWTSDPDTTKPISARITVDGRTVQTLTASAAGASHTGHNFAARFASKSGRHTVCVIGLNTLYGKANSPAACRAITLALKPLGRFESVKRSGDNLLVTGWAFDPDTTGAITIKTTVDGKAAGSFAASVKRNDVAVAYPSAGPLHGYQSVVTTDDTKHTVCLTAVHGTDSTALGCKTVNAVNPDAPSAPRSVKATPGFNAAVVTWAAPTSDGGAPWTKYVVTASPGGSSVTVPATATTATVGGLSMKTGYTFTVRAVNVAGASLPAVSPKVTTQSGPKPQTTPAPVSTSRYIRNIRTCSTDERAWMKRAGAADAGNNPAGHKYMMLLDIGGQSQTYGGVVLSATTRFVTYSALLTCSKYYVDGYHSAQRSGAPAIIAIGVNNDMDVNVQTGRDWANKIVDPLVSYSRKYSNISIVGANDIEPGFSASYSQTKAWLTGYLSSTTARFVFNGSADGCAWTVTNRGCNNGYSMAGLYNLAAGAAPSRIINLPQIYNYTMADQWKYISLTGIGMGKQRIFFGGPLTEVTACAQARSCGSIGGVSAWKRMWSNLQSHSALRVKTLPFATDLRIDR